MSGSVTYQRNKTETEEMLSLLNQQLPMAGEAEMGVLSCLIQDPHRIAECKTTLSPDDFYVRANRYVYSVLLELDESDIGIDVATLTQALREKGYLEACGGPGAISEIFMFIPATAHYPFYTRAILDRSLLRKQIRASAESILDAFRFGAEHVDAEVELHLQRCEQRLREVNSGVVSERDDSMAAWSQLAIDRLEERVTAACKAGSTEGVLPGSSTGIKEIDERIHGL